MTEPENSLLKRSKLRVTTAAAAVVLTAAAAWGATAADPNAPAPAAAHVPSGAGDPIGTARADPNAPPAADPNGTPPADPGAAPPAADPNGTPPADPGAAPPAADPNALPGEAAGEASAPRPVPAEPEEPSTIGGARITRILVEGNQRLTPDAVMHLMTSKPGAPYDESLLRRDFKRIWDRGLLSDLSIEARDEKGGKAIIVHVQEKPVVNNVSYDESKIVGESQIEDTLKERKAAVEIGEPVNYDAVKKAEEAIKGLLGQKGYLDAEVTAELKPAETPASLDVHFKIKEGPRTRIRRIEFTGNTVFSDRRLKKTMRLVREKGWFTRVSGKDIYHPIKFDQDVREVETLYLNSGYIDVDIQPPDVKVVEERASEKPGKSRKWVHITQPVSEGRRYKVGKIDVTGSTVFTADEIRKRIPLREGQVLNNSMLQAGLDAVEANYSQKGYFYISTNRVIDRKPDAVADITVRVSEDKPYRIDRIEFAGNTVTHDSVLRREMQVNEEDLLDIQRIRLGLRRINQLGFFEVQKEPVIKPIEGTDKVSVSIEGIEQRRSELQVGGGYSGLDGGFFTSSYQTRNFLGRGDLVTFNAQTGRISTRYIISFTEPYFLGKPIIFGFSLFRRSTDYFNFRTSGSGGSLTLGRRFRAFHSVSAAYLFEDTDFNPTEGISQNSRTSSLRPAYQFDTRNNFFRPSRGLLFVASAEYTGGLLGGDNYFIKPIVEATRYMKAWRRTLWALHGEVGYVAAFAEDRHLPSDKDGGLPLFERFFLGGERSLRIFETRTVAPDGFISNFFRRRILFSAGDCPAAPEGRRHFLQDRCNGFRVGGDKSVLLNAEYVIPSRGPVDLALFLDAGNVYTEEERIDASELRKDAGVELRFYLPVFGAPLRLIYGFNLDPQRGEGKRNFVFSIGTTF